MQTHRAVALAAVVLAACVNEPPAEPPAAAQQAQAVVEAEANNPEAAALAAALAILEVEILPDESRAAVTFRAALAAAAEAEANNDVKVIFQATINAFNAAEAAVNAAKVEAQTYYNTAAANTNSARAAVADALDAYRTAAREVVVTDSISTAKATRDDAKMVVKAILKLTNARDAYIVAQDAHTAAYTTLEAANKVRQITAHADSDFERFTGGYRGYRGLGYRETQDTYNFAKDYIAAH